MQTSISHSDITAWLARKIINWMGELELGAKEGTNRMSAAGTNHSLEAKNRKNRKAFPYTVQIKLAWGYCPNVHF